MSFEIIYWRFEIAAWIAGQKMFPIKLRLWAFGKVCKLSRIIDEWED